MTTRRQRTGFTITEAAQAFGVTVRALRYYEEIGLIEPDRTPGNARLYSAEVLRKVETVALLRSAGVELADVVAAYGAHDPARISARLIESAHRRLATLETERRALRLLIEKFGSKAA